MVVFGGAGGRSNEGRVNIDGISVGSAFNGAGVSSYIADVGNAREIAMTTSGGLGEAEGGGPALNVLPKEGGNTVRGSFFAAGVTSGMIGSNYTEELRARGLTTPGETRKVWDFNLGVGGPHRAGPPLVLRAPARRRQRADRAGHVRQRQRRRPDEVDVCGRHQPPGRARRVVPHHRARLTAQATPRNKFTLFWDQQLPCEGGAASGFSGERLPQIGRRRGLRRIDGTRRPRRRPRRSAPETAAYRDFGNRVSQVKWTSPLTNRLLLEAGTRHLPQPLRRQAASPGSRPKI